MKSWAFAVFLVLGCGGGGGNTCVAGQSIACACGDGATGAQVCTAAGTYAACECDAGGRANGGGSDMAGTDNTTTGSGNDGGDMTMTPKRVFVTSTAYVGDGINFLSACSDVAKAAGLGNPESWVAWRSAVNGLATYDAINEITGGGPWVLVDGTVVFTTHAQLATTPSVPLTMTETGARLASGDTKVWTGTVSGGTRNGNDCDGWSSASYSGVIGDASSTATWTSTGAAVACTTMAHVYCFEQ